MGGCKEIGENERGQAPLTRPDTQVENKSDGAECLNTSRLTLCPAKAKRLMTPMKGRLKRTFNLLGVSRTQIVERNWRRCNHRFKPESACERFTLRRWRLL